MYRCPTEEQITDIGNVVDIHLEEQPSLLRSSATGGREVLFVSRHVQRPVLSRRLFKCTVHNLSEKFLVIRKLEPYGSQGVFSSLFEQELFLQLSIRRAIEEAKHGKFEGIRVVSTMPMIMDVLLDCGFNSISKINKETSTKIGYVGAKSLKIGGNK